MKSLINLGREPAGTPVLADDVLEFHAARLLLLFKICGVAGRIDGLTKMAKLDFFVRYPQFFERVEKQLRPVAADSPRSEVSSVESSMVRFHYGPWDKRYYHVLSYLEAKGLLAVEQQGTTYQLHLTESGKAVAGQLEKGTSYLRLVEHMKAVKKLLGGKSGTALKDLVYQVFTKEVADKLLGEVIS